MLVPATGKNCVLKFMYYLRVGLSRLSVNVLLDSVSLLRVGYPTVV